MKERKIILGFLALSVSLLALVDIEEEINAPIAQMQMLDDAMNRGIEEQRARNASRPIFLEDDLSFHETPMLEFVLQGKEYILEKSVTDMSNTEITTKLENRMLTITEIKKIEEVIFEEEVVLGTSRTEKRYFTSTTSETMSLPNDADEESLVSEYKNGFLTVRVQKK